MLTSIDIRRWALMACLLISLFAQSGCGYLFDAPHYEDVSLEKAQSFGDSLVAHIGDGDCDWVNDRIDFEEMLDSAAVLNGWSPNDQKVVKPAFSKNGLLKDKPMICENMFAGMAVKSIRTFIREGEAHHLIRCEVDDICKYYLLKIKNRVHRKGSKLIVADVWTHDINEWFISSMGTYYNYLFKRASLFDSKDSKVNDLNSLTKSLNDGELTVALEICKGLGEMRTRSRKSARQCIICAEALESELYNDWAAEALEAFPGDPSVSTQLHSYLFSHGLQDQFIRSQRELGAYMEGLDSYQYSSMGYGYFSLNDFQSALACADSAIAIEPDKSYHHRLRFLTLVHLGDFEKADSTLFLLETKYGYDLSEAPADSMMNVYMERLYSN